MKICLAQTKPIIGDIEANIRDHQRYIEAAIDYKSNIIIFPELSLTAYEPNLAKELATTPEDPRFDIFQELSDLHNISIGAGLPIKVEKGIEIGMLIFQPRQAKLIYAKKYLHPDEDAFFIGGEHYIDLKIDDQKIALAICYEISVLEHTEKAFENGPKIYIASVAKFLNGVEKAYQELADIAKKHEVIVLMANSLGSQDGGICAGKSAIWNESGVLVEQLSDRQAGIMMIDTNTQATKINYWENA